MFNAIKIKPIKLNKNMEKFIGFITLITNDIAIINQVIKNNISNIFVNGN
ncbi:hypothetical protein SAP2_11720 [Staphylococcus arlettae]|nr:hypothetical protein SAP2_11720 [Staphylococcus arlettae]